MDRKQYQDRVSELLDESHALVMRVFATMTDIGEDGSTEEWSTLYNVARSVQVANDLMSSAIQPRPSVFADDLAAEQAKTLAALVRADEQAWGLDA